MKLSILVITFNHVAYIRRALEGLIMQSGISKYEILICDDCSTDDTVAIMKEVLDSVENVSFNINEINLGITKNYQQAFLRCSGEYIAILEGDDYWIDPYKLKKQIVFLDEHPVCSMCSHYFITQQDNQSVFQFPEPVSAQPYLLFDGKDLILNEGIISNFSTCCYRRSMLEKISPATYDVISYEWMINISISEFGFLARLNEPMSVYRHSANGSWSKIPQDVQLKGMYDILPLYDDILGRRLHVFFEKKREVVRLKLSELKKERPKRNESNYIRRLYQLMRGKRI